jgi:hypothetical protein
MRCATGASPRRAAAASDGASSPKAAGEVCASAGADELPRGLPADALTVLLTQECALGLRQDAALQPVTDSLVGPVVECPMLNAHGCDGWVPL